MLPGLSPPFFDFDDLDSAELSSRRGCGDVGNLELAESCPHRHQRKQQVYTGVQRKRGKHGSRSCRRISLLLSPSLGRSQFTIPERFCQRASFRVLPVGLPKILLANSG